ncbi:MAG: prepilin-type N-terminal cleavage/methylation domain-containing protein [Ilumatobacteraceae bacterium]
MAHNRQLVEDAQPAEQPRHDAGFSLVEMVVTIALIGVAVIPIMVAAYAMVKNSNYNRNATRVETVLSNAADRVNRAGGDCGYTDYYNAAVQSAGWKTEQISVQYEWYEPGVNAAAPGVWHIDADGCPDGTGYTDELVQRITITLTSPDGAVSRSVQVVKSKI